MEALAQQLRSFKSIVQVRLDLQKNLILAVHYLHHPEAANESKALEALVNQHSREVILIPTQERPVFTLQ